MSANNLSHILRVLSDITNQHANDIARHARDQRYSTEKETCSSCLVFNSFHNGGGRHSINAMTSFFSEEFTEMWFLMAERFQRREAWTEVRKPKSGAEMRFSCCLPSQSRERSGISRLSCLQWVQVLSRESSSEFGKQFMLTFMTFAYTNCKESGQCKSVVKKTKLLVVLTTRDTDLTFHQSSRPAENTAEGKV